METSMADEPSVPLGLVLAFELLVAELARSQSIDALRFVSELETASTSLGPGNEQSEAARLLKLMALQIRQGLPKAT
jgi:hypothetical protein